MNKKTFAILNIIIVVLYGAYLISSSYVEYSKSVKLIVSIIYLVFAIIDLVFWVREYRVKK